MAIAKTHRQRPDRGKRGQVQPAPRNVPVPVFLRRWSCTPWRQTKPIGAGRKAGGGGQMAEGGGQRAEDGGLCQTKPICAVLGSGTRVGRRNKANQSQFGRPGRLPRVSVGTGHRAGPALGLFMTRYGQKAIDCACSGRWQGVQSRRTCGIETEKEGYAGEAA